jgi:hypothetical protein
MGEDDYGWYDDPGWNDPGQGDPVAIDPGQDPTVGSDPFADFTGADDSGIIWENGEVVGMDLGDGTWANLDGEIFDQAGNSLGFLDLYFSGKSFDELAPGITPDSGTGGGFLSGIGDFFKNLFGGSGGGSGGAGGAMGSAMGQLSSKAQQAAQNLSNAQQQGASTQTLQALQRQLYMAQQALTRMQGGGISPLLIAGAVGLGVYFLAKSRD